MHDAQYWIQKLQLTPHPEGGFFRQTYRADLTLEMSALPSDFTGTRSVSTAIYFLLSGSDFSALHRIASDEVWHFYSGNPLSIHIIEEEGRHKELRLGANPEAGENFQAVVPAGCWFASGLVYPESYALVGCTVSPGFDFEDFELADRLALIRQYPQHKTLIEQFTRTARST